MLLTKKSWYAHLMQKTYSRLPDTWVEFIIFTAGLPIVLATAWSLVAFCIIAGKYDTDKANSGPGTPTLAVVVFLGLIYLYVLPGFWMLAAGLLSFLTFFISMVILYEIIDRKEKMERSPWEEDYGPDYKKRSAGSSGPTAQREPWIDYGH